MDATTNVCCVAHALNNRRHILDRPTHVFNGFLGTGQETLPINEVTGMSRDNVGLCFDAAITVQVVDGAKAVPVLGGGQQGGEGSSFKYEAFRKNIIQKVSAFYKMLLVAGICCVLSENCFTTLLIDSATGPSRTFNYRGEQQIQCLNGGFPKAQNQ